MSQMAIKTQTLNEDQCDHCNGYCYLINCKLSLKNCYEDPYIRSMPIFSVSIFSTCERNETEWRWWELLEYKSTCVTIIISIVQYVPFLSWVRSTLTQQIGLLTMYAILDKMLRQMGVTLSSFKIKLLKALATTNTSLPLLPHQKNDVELQLDLFWPRLITCDQGEGRGYSGTKSTGYAFCGKESTKFLTPFFQDCGSSYSCSSVGWALQC